MGLISLSISVSVKEVNIPYRFFDILANKQFVNSRACTDMYTVCINISFQYVVPRLPLHSDITIFFSLISLLRQPKRSIIYRDYLCCRRERSNKEVLFFFM